MSHWWILKAKKKYPWYDVIKMSKFIVIKVVITADPMNTPLAWRLLIKASVGVQKKKTQRWHW